jgi:hypothetical protein
MPPVLPSPSDFSAPAWAAWGFLFYAGALVVLLALPWALRSGLRKGNWLPLTMLGSGFLCSLLEPMLDFLGHLRWADNLLMTHYQTFGIEIPLLIPPCYAAFLGLEGYWVYTMLNRGITTRQALTLFAACSFSDAVMETPGLAFHVYEYYGVQPFRFFHFPYWWGFINGASIFTVGFLLWLLVPRLKGAQKAALVIASPTGMMIAYFTAGWPHLLTLNSTAPTWCKWLACAVTMAACVGLVRFLAGFAAVEEPTVNWTFARFFLYRFAFPATRERLLATAGAQPSDARAVAPADAPAPQQATNDAPARTATAAHS